MYRMLRHALFAVDGETAHTATIRALAAMPPARAVRPDPMLATRVAGLAFPNPIGVAAGFDKNAQAAHAMPTFGFGFVEVGTLTPRPQAGNPRPRLFRLADDRAVINRMGFNNAGQQAAIARLAALRLRPGSAIVGVNIGANKASVGSDAALEDYAQGVRAMGPVADYLAINISSPNTPGLRALQDKGALDALLAAITAARAEAEASARPPIFLKVAPDLEAADIDAIVALAAKHRLDALIIANTTLSRPPLAARHAGEAGGLSGEPLRALAQRRLEDFRAATGGTIPLVGVGGIASGADAYARIRAGASLVQLYSALVYEGPFLARRIAAELKTLLARDGFRSVAEAVGTAAR